VNCKLQTSEDKHKFTQLRGLVGEGPLQEKWHKSSEGEPQVCSVKKTCRSEFEDVQKVARSVSLQHARVLVSVRRNSCFLDCCDKSTVNLSVQLRLPHRFDHSIAS